MKYSLTKQKQVTNNYFQLLVLTLNTVLLVLLFVSPSQQYCSKFGRHLLQHQCVLTPEGTEGPYYLPRNLIRRDIREDRQGLPFRLKLTITDVNSCEPLRNVSVDIWQCDASGKYSGYIGHRPTSVQHAQPTDNTTFLRGVQITDDNGRAEFNTIFPGWYGGRTTHIHIQTHMGGKTVYTGQLYFTDKLVNRIARMQPYNMTTGHRNTNEGDYIFRRDSGNDTIIKRIKMIKQTNRLLASGLVGEMIIGLNPNTESPYALYGKGKR
ncbi:uncharacterized protein LOC128953966 [Oppia nitens]|uniref:uncharacterized protein LOC128953966 n=1 Tax=Oppia nitens TaxID=1686743 RepID=UPI0023DCAB16|nr:uncharacterized protein LOC128953966 [Oppia nitens]